MKLRYADNLYSRQQGGVTALVFIWPIEARRKAYPIFLGLCAGDLPYHLNWKIESVDKIKLPLFPFIPVDTVGALYLVGCLLGKPRCIGYATANRHCLGRKCTGYCLLDGGL